MADRWGYRFIVIRWTRLVTPSREEQKTKRQRGEVSSSSPHSSSPPSSAGPTPYRGDTSLLVSRRWVTTHLRFYCCFPAYCSFDLLVYQWFNGTIVSPAVVTTLAFPIIYRFSVWHVASLYGILGLPLRIFVAVGRTLFSPVLFDRLTFSSFFGLSTKGLRLFASVALRRGRRSGVCWMNDSFIGIHRIGFDCPISFVEYINPLLPFFS